LLKSERVKRWCAISSAQVAPAAAGQPPATTLATTPSVELTVTGEAPSRTVSVTIVLPGVAKISEVELAISPY
jgi:hypothetical protein